MSAAGTPKRERRLVVRLTQVYNAVVPPMMTALSPVWRGVGLNVPAHFYAPIPDSVTVKEVARYLFKKTFPLWQALGFHLVPAHFYEPIPDTRALQESLWQRRSELVGIDLNEERQLRLLSQFAAAYKDEYDRWPREKTHIPHQYYSNNFRFGSVDGEVFYSIIRQFKPRRIIEVGSGYSTYLAAQAVLENRKEGAECDLVACEPYPIDALRAGFPGLSELRQVKAQDIPPSEFARLQENDILFIDSSHVLKIGSDVCYEYLEVLPRLNRGVLVHLHDIFLPAEYPREWVKKNYWFWNEQYLLQAFLAFNHSFEVLWAASYMHLQHPDCLAQVFASYERQRHWPGSFWIRKVA